VTFESPDGNAAAVDYEPPQVVAGEPPLKVSCAPPRGSVFPLGTTAVSCNVTDSALRTNACAFTVTVVRRPRLSATRFMAFGNSITAGEPGSNYPAMLQTMLTARYAAQAPVIRVINRGVGGERSPDGADRLPEELADVRPDAVLIEEGVNDIFGGTDSRVPIIIEALEDMIRKVRRRPNVAVLLATLLPTRQGSPKGDNAFPLVPEVNRRIRDLAVRQNVVLVDLYEGFGGSADPYIGPDGLHPNEQGYRKMAEIFFDRIRATLEDPQAVPGSIQFVRHGGLPELP
jgi:lysophospholipase L1-like esterase